MVPRLFPKHEPTFWIYNLITYSNSIQDICAYGFARPVPIGTLKFSNVEHDLYLDG